MACFLGGYGVHSRGIWWASLGNVGFPGGCGGLP